MMKDNFFGLNAASRQIEELNSHQAPNTPQHSARTRDFC